MKETRENYSEIMAIAKKEATREVEQRLERPLFLSEIAAIEHSATMAELGEATQQIYLGLLASHQYEHKTGHSFTGDLTIDAVGEYSLNKAGTLPAGTDLNTITKVGTWTVPDEYANITSFVAAPSQLTVHIPIMNTMVTFPMNNGELTQTAVERGIDLIADLMEIDGVKEVLEKYGAEIKPL